MKFSRLLQTKVVPEWIDFYLNFKILKKIISPYKYLGKTYSKAEIEAEHIVISNYDWDDLERLKKFNVMFETVIFKELQKISAFYHARMREIIKKWRMLKINEILLKDIKGKADYVQKKEMLQKAFQIYYQELKLLSEYITINLEAFRKIFKKHRKYVKPFDPSNDVKARFEEMLREKNVHYHKECLNNLIAHVEQEYMELFYNRGNRKEGQEELRKILQGRLISQDESFYFGFFLGLCFAFIVLMWVIAWLGDLSADDDELFKNVFPIFRGIGLLILYVWLLAWNVYIWTKFNINYKLIFKFSYHYSTISEILGRASFFTSVFLIMFLWYIILRQEMHGLSELVDFLPKDYTPLIVWLMFLGYIFFPSTTLFNPQGRLYCFRLFKEIATSPWHKATFRLNWATDQLASFVVPLKDFEYMLCFYSASNKEESQMCQSSSTRFSSAVFMAFIPLVLRIIQCCRQMYDAKQFISPFFFNAIKYLLSAITVLFSYFSAKYNHPGLFACWIFFASISTIYSYYWDLKMDWGFLVPNCKNKMLRNELAYNNNKTYYYMAMSVNLLLRCAWVLSISPDITRRWFRPELFQMVIGFMEIFRRSVWNLLRVEKEHIANVGSFKAVDDYKLPFEKIEINMDERYLFKNELINLLEKETDEEDMETSFADFGGRFIQTDQQPPKDEEEKVETELKEKDLFNKKDPKQLQMPLLTKGLSIFSSQGPTMPEKKLKKVTSFLTISTTDLNSYRVDAAEIKKMKQEVSEYKEEMKAKADTYFVNLTVPMELVKNASTYSKFKKESVADGTFPRISSVPIMTPKMTKEHVVIIPKSGLNM